MAVAAIKFTQGVTTDLAGRALIGVAGALVNVTNGDNTGVTSYRIELLDVPFNSVLPEGVLVDAIGPTPFASFTPDVSGTYQLRLRLNGDDSIIDVRDFIVPNSVGWLIPAVKSNAQTFNYAGQLKGWKTALNQAFADLAALGNPSFAGAVQTVVNLRAIAAISRTDKQVRLVEDVPSLYRFDANTGASVADDGYLIIKPDDVLFALPGRWYKLPATTTFDVQDKLPQVGYVSTPNAPVPTDYLGVAAYRGDVAGVPRDRACLVWDELNGVFRLTYVDPDDVTLTGDLGIWLGQINSSILVDNRLVFVGAGGSITSPAFVSVSGTQTFNFASDVRMNALTLNNDQITWDNVVVVDRAGTGTPNGTITANIGSVFRDTVGSLWFKFEDNGGNTGWYQVVHTGDSFLAGDVTGTVDANRVEALRGDSTNQFVNMLTSSLRIGTSVGSGAYAATGQLRVNNSQSFKLSVRNGFQIAGTGDVDLIHYNPSGAVLEFGNSTFAAATSTSLHGTTVYGIGNTAYLQGAINSYIHGYLSTSMKTTASGTNLAEAATIGGTRKVLSLLRDANVTTTQVPNGDRIAYIGRAATEPTSSPVTGVNMWVDTLDTLWVEYGDGNIHRTDHGGFASITIAGGNYTLVRSEYRQGAIRVVASDANRDLIFPAIEGKWWFVTNEATGDTITCRTSAQVGGVTMTNNDQVIVMVAGGNVITLKEI